MNRRFRKNFQGGLTYAYMFALHDDGTIGYTAPAQNNQFNYLDGEYATSTDFPFATSTVVTGCAAPCRSAALTSQEIYRVRGTPGGRHG